MDIIAQLKDIGQRVLANKSLAETEEATKTAFVLPFIAAMGYDVFNPAEVKPEFIADIGIKKGEKIDYCIFKDGHPIILIECKHWRSTLDVHQSQLHRYFHATKARIGILTNGIIYRFYSDLEESNKMDNKPFLEFDITDIREGASSEIKAFQKQFFNIDAILNSANDLKYTKEIKTVLGTLFDDPTEEFVKIIASKVYSGRFTSKLLEQFKILTKKSLDQFLSDSINDRLKNALKSESERIKEKEVIEDEMLSATVDQKNNQIETTVLELEAFYIVKSLLRENVDPTRICYRDNQSYMAVLLDDNNRKTLCRLHMNASNKYLGIIDQAGKESRMLLNTLEDIYSYKQQLVEVLMRYNQPQAVGK